MRALILLVALFSASATAFSQAQMTVTPLPSSVCSIPLVRFAAPDIDPLIVKKMPPASDRMPQLRVPAPPCEEPGAQPAVIAQRLGERMKRLFSIGKSEPVGYVSVLLPSRLKESLEP